MTRVQFHQDNPLTHELSAIRDFAFKILKERLYSPDLAYY
jgi:hypothetical protein